MNKDQFCWINVQGINPPPTRVVDLVQRDHRSAALDAPVDAQHVEREAERLMVRGVHVDGQRAGHCKRGDSTVVTVCCRGTVMSVGYGIMVLGTVVTAWILVYCIYHIGWDDYNRVG